MKPTKRKLNDLPTDLYEENLLIHNRPLEVPEMKNYLIITADEILKTDTVTDELKSWAEEGHGDIVDITDPAYPAMWDSQPWAAGTGSWDDIEEAQGDPFGYDAP